MTLGVWLWGALAVLPCRGAGTMPAAPRACSFASRHVREGAALGLVSVPRALRVPLTPGAGGTGPGSQGQGLSPATSAREAIKPEGLSPLGP